jgi:hypothetical protein
MHMYTNGTLTWPHVCDVNFFDTGIVGSDSSQSLEISLIYFCDVQLTKSLSKESIPNANKQDLEKATFKVVIETLINIQVFWNIKAV